MTDYISCYFSLYKAVVRNSQIAMPSIAVWIFRRAERAVTTNSLVESQLLAPVRGQRPKHHNRRGVAKCEPGNHAPRELPNGEYFRRDPKNTIDAISRAKGASTALPSPSDRFSAAQSAQISRRTLTT